MFAGREFYYFRVSSSVTLLPVVSPAETTADPAPASVSSDLWLEIFPLMAVIISLMMVWIIAKRLWQKFRPHEAIWAVAFSMFAIAAGIQIVGDVIGWTEMLARFYYVLGATLVVGWLGLGTWLLLARNVWLQNLGLWTVLLMTGLGFGLILLTPVDASTLATEGWHALEKPAVLTVLTIITNTFGTIVLVGGALWSAWVFYRQRIMQQRMYGLILIAVGAMVVAAGGSLTRLGHQQYLYIAMSIGISLMFWGYLKTIQPMNNPVRHQAENPSLVPDANLASGSI